LDFAHVRVEFSASFPKICTIFIVKKLMPVFERIARAQPSRGHRAALLFDTSRVAPLPPPSFGNRSFTMRHESERPVRRIGGIGALPTRRARCLSVRLSGL